MASSNTPNWLTQASIHRPLTAEELHQQMIALEDGKLKEIDRELRRLEDGK